MEKFDRFYQLYQLLKGRRTPISKRDLAKDMECTEKTVQRYLDQFRDYYAAPLEYVPGLGWRFEDGAECWELPGLWLTDKEIQSLLLLLDMLNRFSNGLLNDELASIRQLVNRLLEKRGIESGVLLQKIRIIPHGHQAIPDHRLNRLFTALVSGNQSMLDYVDFKGTKTRRKTSPQRLIYYRDNWYLDAWCHKRQAIRTFAISRIESIFPSDESAELLADDDLDRHFEKSYGVFAGEPTRSATLRFFPTVAREIARQQWHPDQSGKWEGDEYLLSIPYSDDRELILDILRYCPNVYVESPVTLRRRVQSRLQDALGVFTGKRIRV